MPELTPLVPIWLLLLGSLLTASLGRWMRPKESAAVALASFGAAFASLAALAASGEARTQVPLWPGGAAFGGGLALRGDGLAQLCGLALLAGALLTTLAWASGARLPQEARFLAPAQAAAAGAIGCLYAANALTLYVAWGLLDLALLLLLLRTPGGQEVAVRATLVSVLGGGALLAASLLAVEDPISFGPAGMAGLPGALLAFAIFSRLALYPLHVTLADGWGALPRRVEPLLLAPWVVGAFLAAKHLGAASGEPALAGWLTALAGVGLVAAAVLAWCQQGAERAVGYVVLHQGALIVLLAVAGGSWVELGVGWMVLGCVLAVVAVLSVWPEARVPGFRWAPWGARAFLAIGLGGLVGAPATAGFAGRLALGTKLLAGGDRLLWGLAIVSGALVVARLVRIWRIKPVVGPRGEGRGALAAQATAALALVAMGVWPGLAWPGLGGPSWGEILQALEGPHLPVAAASMLALGLGLAAYRLKAPHEPAWAWRRVGAILGLDWLYLAAGGIGVGLSRLIGGLVELVEGRYYMGWVFLLSVLVIILVLAT